MTWGRTLENALASKGISKEFKEWIAIAKDRPKWRHVDLERLGSDVNARESIRVTGGNIDWIYPGRNELTSYTID